MEAKKGITLMELLIVSVLVTVMASLSIGYLSKQSLKGRDAKRKAELRLVQNALEIYRANNDLYPQDNTGQIQGCNTIGSPTACPWGSAWSQTNAQSQTIEYHKKLPTDPKTGWSYFYKRHATNNQKYYLCAKLENSGDSDYQSSAPDCSGYNYELTEP